ncbi:MAG: outer membrane protein assembly factor BamA [Sulfurovaceae bacterium]|nr:outer membrane protein assembly factor BamA [Sulfurovaceae bacterium]
MLKKTSLVWISFGAFLFAQNITKIEYDGLHSLSPSAINEISGVKVGENLSKSSLDAGVKNIMSQGYFKDVTVETKNGGVVVFHFIEKPAIANVEINGYGSEDSNKQLIEAMGLKRGELYDDAKMQKAKSVFQAKLASEGVYDATVDIQTKTVGEDGVSLIFDVKKGDKIKITEIKFIGNNALSDSDLESAMANKEEGWFGWIPFLDRGTAYLGELEKDAFRIKDAYAKEGYIDARVSKPLLQVDGQNNAKIEIQIEEGMRYKVGDVVINQNIEGLAENLKDDPKLKKGKYFDVGKLRQDMQYLQEQTANLGYAYATVEPVINKDEANGIVNIQYNITPGSKVTINDVLISGNTETKDSVIRRYIYLAPGDTYSQTDLKDSKNAIGRTGFFEKYDLTPQKLDDNSMNLLVNVKEAPTGSFAIGGGYSSYEGAMLEASVSDRNLFGTGISASIGADLSKISTDFNLQFTNPRVWDSLYSVSLDVHKKKYDYTDYSLDQTGASLTVGREFMRNFYASAGIAYADNQSKVLKALDPADPYAHFYDDKYQKLSGVAGIKFDNTDDYYVPRSGFILSLNGEIAQLDGTPNATASSTPYNYTDFSDFVKLNAKLGAYYGLQDLIDYDLILRYKARGSWLNSNGYLPAAERLYLGGVGSVRGYDSWSISPEVTGVGKVGGTWTFSNTVEASIPISEEAKIRLAFFADWGIIGSDDYYNQSFSNESRSSAGASLEWFSPFGPINFIFSKAINPEAGDKTSSFEFTMGTKF